MKILKLEYNPNSDVKNSNDRVPVKPQYKTNGNAFKSRQSTVQNQPSLERKASMTSEQLQLKNQQNFIGSQYKHSRDDKSYGMYK